MDSQYPTVTDEGSALTSKKTLSNLYIVFVCTMFLGNEFEPGTAVYLGIADNRDKNHGVSIRKPGALRTRMCFIFRHQSPLFWVAFPFHFLFYHLFYFSSLSAVRTRRQVI